MQRVETQLRKKVDANETDLFSYFRDKQQLSTVLDSEFGPNTERLITWTLQPILDQIENP